MTTATETLEQEYNRLLGERAELGARTRKSTTVTPEDSERFSAVMRRIRDIAAIPPEGYELPKPAADLVAHAEAHGWLTLVQWTALGYAGNPFVTVQVGRKVAEEDGYLGLGSSWKYSLTWHSRGCAPGKVRLFGSGTASTPASPGTGSAPSVKAIRAVIEQHPAPEAVRTA